MSTRKPVEILVVEDSLTQAQRLEHTLVERGYQVRHAPDGEAALAMIQERTPDMIISDVIMPQMDGYELCAKVKAHPDLAHVPVILVTTLSDPADVIRGLECRADNFILKPYDDKYLLNRVQYMLLNRDLRHGDPADLALKIYFNGRQHVITADRLQILNLLLSTYDAAIQRNKELTRSKDALAERSAALVERERELDAANAFLDSIIENVPSTIFVKDARDLRYVRVNRAFEDLFGYHRSEVLGKTPDDIFPPEEAAPFAAADRQALDQGQLVDIPESAAHTRSRGIRLLHTRKIPILKEGVAQYILGITEDVTDRRASEQGLAAAKLDAERASHAKSEFLSRMSHELRTPLNAILGFAQLLKTDALDAEQDEAVGHILTGGAHLLDLINEILDISRIEAGHLTLSPEPVQLAEAVRQVVELVRPLAAQRAVVIEADSVAGQAVRHVMADRQRLNQVLLNLLSNAVKYNRERGLVRVTYTEAPHDRIRVSVTDTGMGIPRAKLPLLFQPFERLDAHETGIEGTGLGLALAAALVEAMGGTIGVESEVNRGSTFWLDLPLCEMPEGLSVRAVARPRRTVREDPNVTGTILYIEDNTSNWRLMQRVLKRRPGVRLVGVPTGQAGIELARGTAPDLVLLDLHLPDIPGEEVLRVLREDARTRTIPVAVLSADATAANAKRLIASGASGYLTKPIDVQEVLHFLDEALANPR